MRLDERVRQLIQLCEVAMVDCQNRADCPGGILFLSGHSSLRYEQLPDHLRSDQQEVGLCFRLVYSFPNFMDLEIYHQRFYCSTDGRTNLVWYRDTNGWDDGQEEYNFDLDTVSRLSWRSRIKVGKMIDRFTNYLVAYFRSRSIDPIQLPRSVQEVNSTNLPRPTVASSEDSGNLPRPAS